MSIFQNSVINKYLSTLDNDEINDSFQKFNKFYCDKERLENIKLLKEENYQEGFLRELFVQVLGYTLNPDKEYNLTTEYKNLTDARKADGAILKSDKAIGVIELKSTKTKDLEQIKGQAFSYKNHHENCRYIITSNFEKIRFYIDNATEFEEFILFNLDIVKFRVLYLLLSKESVFNEIPLKLKEESKIHEENISDKLYQDYSQFKHKIFSNLTLNNKQHDKLFLFKKSQKLLDRFLFVLFAEDKGLVPPNATSRIIDQWRQMSELDEPVSLYSRFVKLFHHLDIGHKYKTWELHAYNGGLFRKDDRLDNLIIDDEALLFDIQKLAAYDFLSEVDVNILGHIFEHSLSEIEEINAELQGKEVDKQKTKKKREGVFYTPKYITKYIVDNTLGVVLDLKKNELQLHDIDMYILQNCRTTKGNLTKKAKDLLGRLDSYREYLLSLKILDPACGSGAFLNQALESLISEHELIDEYRNFIFDEPLGLYDITKAILEKNLYGVDINEEAIEIAKLSLWLRTAEKGRKLSDLSEHIKCGNSLIDDPEIAGEKAFAWANEFPDVMKGGGFNVVIGNPPYGDYFNKDEKDYILQTYPESFSGTFDIYITFFDLALKVLKDKGLLGFITPNTFIDYSQFSGLRKLLLKQNNIESIIQIRDVFDDAIVDNAIIVLSKGLKQKGFFRGKIFKKRVNANFDLNLDKLNKNNLSDKCYILKSMGTFSVDKLLVNSIELGEFVKITQGITTGGNTCFLGKRSDFIKSGIDESLIKKMLKGKNINRYKIQYDEEYILYSTPQVPIDDQNDIADYLKPYKEKLSKKRETKQGKLPWYCLHWPRDENDFNKPKILIRQTASKIIGVLDTSNYYPIDSIHTLNLIHESEDSLKQLHYLIGIINSKLFDYLYYWRMDEEGKVYPQIKKVNIEWLPIKKYKHDEIISNYVKEIQFYNDEFELINRKFLKFIERSFELKNNLYTLSNWFELDYMSFISQLNKVIKKTGGSKLSKKSEIDWMDLFEDNKLQVINKKYQISKIDTVIDKIVYKMYGLTDEDIKIVERTINGT